MNFKFLLGAAVILGSVQISTATVTLQFGQTGVARATGFANNGGTPTNGMRWGIVIDSAGDGFGAGGYDVFSQEANGFLSIGSVTDDDYYVTTGLSTNLASATGADAAVTAGAITQLSNILGPSFPTSPAGNVTASDAFRIIWFESAPSNGTFYGMMGDASFLLPADGNTTSFASAFVGNDPNKPANLQFGAVPEPSRLMLLGIGLVGVFARRRRS